MARAYKRSLRAKIIAMKTLLISSHEISIVLLVRSRFLHLGSIQIDTNLIVSYGEESGGIFFSLPKKTRKRKDGSTRKYYLLIISYRSSPFQFTDVIIGNKKKSNKKKTYQHEDKCEDTEGRSTNGKRELMEFHSTAGMKMRGWSTVHFDRVMVFVH